MSSIEKFEDMDSWRLARSVTKSLYDLTRDGDFSRDFPLVNQIRRAAISVLSNIAEGFERNGDREFIQFLTIAKGSCGELRAQLYIALDQGYIPEQKFNSLTDDLTQVSKMLAGLIRYLQSSELKGSKFKGASSS